MAKGADFVILPGDGVAGGPPCGLLVGRQPEVAWIQQSTAWPTLAARQATVAMMTVALELAAGGGDATPVGELISTSEENLRDRAERMATRLGGSDQISSCQIKADDAQLIRHGRWRFRSRQLLLRHASMTADAWASQLREELPAVLANVDGDDLCVDLRWISAADDGQLAETLGGDNS